MKQLKEVNRMKVKFLQDFQGRETHNIFYRLGEIVELERETAVLLIHDKRCEEVLPIESEQPELEAKPKRGKK